MDEHEKSVRRDMRQSKVLGELLLWIGGFSTLFAITAPGLLVITLPITIGGAYLRFRFVPKCQRLLDKWEAEEQALGVLWRDK